MPVYTAYNKKTGEITKQGFATDPLLQINTEVEDYLLIDCNTPGYKVDIVNKKLIFCGVKTTAADVIALIHEPEEVLNAMIAKITSDISGWRQQHYVALRYNAYPPMIDYIDAQVKLASSDFIIEAQGQIQMDEYCNACLAVKLRFPRSI